MISCRVEIRCKDFLLISKTWDFLWKMSVITYLLSPSATFDISCLGAPRTEVLVGLVLEELIPCRGVFACRPYENEHIIGCGFWWTHNLFKDTSKWWDTKIELKVKWFYGRIGKKKNVQFQIFQPQFSCHDCCVHDKTIMKNCRVLPRSPHQHLWPWSQWDNPIVFQS